MYKFSSLRGFGWQSFSVSSLSFLKSMQNLILWSWPWQQGNDTKSRESFSITSYSKGSLYSFSLIGFAFHVFIWWLTISVYQISDRLFEKKKHLEKNIKTSWPPNPPNILVFYLIHPFNDKECLLHSTTSALNTW